MPTIRAEPLTVEAFAPFGDVLEAPAEPGRVYFERALASTRAKARPSVSLVTVAAHTAPTLLALRMERHEFSSQTFVPLEPARWLVLVAPRLADGGPDASRARAFIAGPGQGITYAMNVWHHPLTVLDCPARFAIFMWLETPATDEEFRTLGTPLTIEL